MADFSANDPFHVELEKISRRIWAPAGPGTIRQCRWFYERATGQYADEKGRKLTASQKRAFEDEYPSKQKFRKEDMARYEFIWAQKPSTVVLGGQKNFRHFMAELKERGKVTPDEAYFERLVAKMLLYRAAEKVHKELGIMGYRSHLSAYTVAWLSHATAQRLDLSKIWKAQQVPEAITDLLKEVMPLVSSKAQTEADSRNLGEFYKRKECWDAIKEIEVNIPKAVTDLYVERSSQALVSITAPDGLPATDDQHDAIKAIRIYSAQDWFTVSKWAKDTNNLQPFQRSIAFSLGKVLGSGRDPSPKQAVQGLKIMEEAQRLGFTTSVTISHTA